MPPAGGYCPFVNAGRPRGKRDCPKGKRKRIDIPFRRHACYADPEITERFTSVTVGRMARFDRTVPHSWAAAAPSASGRSCRRPSPLRAMCQVLLRGRGGGPVDTSAAQIRHGTGRPRPYTAAMTPDLRPGLDPRRLVRLMGATIEQCGLDLSGLTVLTEAANGAYVVTPVLAAMAGAEVHALAAGTAYASAEHIRELTEGLAQLAGVLDRIHLAPRKDIDIVSAADIITNSGQVRPIDSETVAQMKPSAVVPLMYESWEYRHTDVDLTACRSRGVAVAGTNERHPAVDVFSFLGQM